MDVEQVSAVGAIRDVSHDSLWRGDRMKRRIELDRRISNFAAHALAERRDPIMQRVNVHFLGHVVHFLAESLWSVNDRERL